MAPRAPFAQGQLNTQLSPLDEMAFRSWVNRNKVPFDPNAPPSDYDMRGYYQAREGQNPIAQSSVNQNDGLMHYPDYWKNPSHQSFSSESRLAGPNAPSWTGDKLISPAGRVVYDETGGGSMNPDPRMMAQALMQRPGATMPPDLAGSPGLPSPGPGMGGPPMQPPAVGGPPAIPGAPMGDPNMPPGMPPQAGAPPMPPDAMNAAMGASPAPGMMPTQEMQMRGNAAMNVLPPRAGNGFVDERNALGMAAMNQLPPQSYPVPMIGGPPPGMTQGGGPVPPIGMRPRY